MISIFTLSTLFALPVNYPSVEDSGHAGSLFGANTS